MQTTLHVGSGDSIRMISNASGRYWVAKDVLQFLGVCNASERLKDMSENDRPVMVVETPGGPQRLLCLTDAGLIRLVFSVRTPRSQHIQDWFIQRTMSTDNAWDDFATAIQIAGRDAVRLREQGGYVYLWKCGDHHKIGKSKDVKKRLMSFNLPGLTSIATIPSMNMTVLEGELHARYAASRVKGEWFSLTEAQVREILSHPDVVIE